MEQEPERRSTRDIQDLFVAVVTASAPLVGESYFEKVPKILSDAWGAAAFIVEVDVSGHAGACQFLGAAGLEADVRAGTRVGHHPWGGEATSAAIYYPSRVGVLFPDESLLRGAEAYLAVPLVDSHGRRIGYAGLVDTQPWSARTGASAESLLRLVAPRASSELERYRLHDRLLIELRNFHALAAETDEGFLSWTGREQPRLMFINQAFERLTGYSREEVVAHAEVVVDQIRRALPLEGGSAALSPAIIPFQRKDGREVEVEATLTADRGTSGGALYRCILRMPVEPRRTSFDDSWSEEVLRHLPFAAIVLQGDDVVFMNDRGREVTGSSAENVLESIVVLRDAQGELSLTLGAFARRVAKSRTSRVMLKLKLRRGNERLIQMRIRRISLPGGPGMILTPLDLTDDRLLREQLEYRADLYARILASFPLDIVVTDAQAVVTARTDRLSESLDADNLLAPRAPAVAIGDDYVEAYQRQVEGLDEGGRDVLRGIAAVLARSASGFAHQYVVKDNNGQRRSLLVAAAPLEGGGAIITHSDITALKREERDLVEREERAWRLLGHLPDQLARISAQGIVDEVIMPAPVSHTVAPLPRAPMRRHVSELLPREAADRLQKAIHDSLQTNAITSCIVRLPYGDDEREYEMRVVPSTPEECLVCVRDRMADQVARRQAEDAEHGEHQRVVRENPYGLTFREVDVLQLMAQGASDKEIASTLGVSVFTVYKHVSKILHKMDAPSRTEASLRTIREHMFD